MSSSDLPRYADDAERQHMLPELKECLETWQDSETASIRSELTQEDETKDGLDFNQIYSIALHLVIILLTLLLWLSRMESHAQNSSPTQGRTWSPVLPFVEHEISGENALDHDKITKFSGPPTVEQEKAWDDLVLPIHFRATRDELEQAGETIDDAVELYDGGYLATTGVYHELHCLRRLRWYLYKDQYYPNITTAQEDYLQSHLDHCLETLRVTIMCHGNSALYSFKWPSTDPDHPLLKPVAKTNAKDVCVKWRSIEDYSYSRMVAPDHLLKNPLVTQS